MIEHIPPNHEASTEMLEVVSAFGNEHGLEGNVELAKVRINDAVEARAEIVKNYL